MQIINAEILTGDPLRTESGAEDAVRPLVDIIDSELVSRGDQPIQDANYEFMPYIMAYEVLFLSGARFVDTNNGRLEQKAHFALVMNKEDKPYFLSLANDGSITEGNRAFAFDTDMATIIALHRIALARVGIVN